ncbi:MAG: HypC/HybG/HupF family hydrogenase formation chaperone [Gammaproteobacteria bacterium]|nr:HypC/HybG/HupF family hydrogenase formation chaperone [Gammaproteobacteria bacterium]
MCLAIPARIIEIDANAENAIADIGGIKKRISLALVEDIELHDYVLIHVGYALSKIDPDEATKTLELFQQAKNGI